MPEIDDSSTGVPHDVGMGVLRRNDMRACLVCGGEGTGPVRAETGLVRLCLTCKGTGKIEDPEHDALVKRVEALEEQMELMATALTLTQEVIDKTIAKTNN